MRTSDSIIKIAPALLKAQKDMEGAKKDSNNPFFKSKYSDFNSVLEACKKPLNDNGIVILQPHRVDINSNGVYMVVETILLHESGEFISGETKVEVAKQNDPQALGSAQTYAKRYGLQSIVSLPSEDDDANLASGKSAAQAQPAKPVAKPSAPASGFGSSKPAEVKAESKPASGFGAAKVEVGAQEVKAEPSKAPARTGSFGAR